MNMRWPYLVLVICLAQAMASNPVNASPKIKYGEWQINIAVKGLPIAVPEQTQYICLKKDHLVPAARKEQDCKMKWSLHHGTTVKWTMKCSNGSNGKGSATYAGDKMHGYSEINVPNGHMRMRSNLTGKWVAAKCSARSQH